MTAWVLGADTSLRRTGLAAIGMSDRGIIGPHTWLAATDPPGVDSVAHRVRRLTQLRLQVQRVLDLLVGTPVLALVEAPSYGNHADAGFHENAGAWWAVVETLVAAGAPGGTCAPQTRAKWATGNGRADKRAVVAAMRELWPDAGCVRGDTRTDECDALALATAAAQHLGWPVSVRGWHGASLEVIRWPTLPAATG